MSSPEQESEDALDLEIENLDDSSLEGDGRISGLVLAISVAAGVIIVDQITKWWAVGRLDPGPCTPDTCIDLVGSLRFRLHYNTGAAFSRGEGFGLLLGILAIAMSIYLMVLAKHSLDRVSTILLGAIAGGAVGNVIDRIARAEDGWFSGGVVDFIDAQFWPIFNIADVAIVCGVVGLLIRQMMVSEPDSR